MDVSGASVQAPRWDERVAEWAGAVVVKEVRAGLKSKAFVAAFGVMVLAGFVVLLVNGVVALRQSSPRGSAAFFGACVALAVYGQALAPFIAYRAMVREREDETWVLLVLTGLGTPGIVRGKVLAALSQVALGVSATTPFILMSYLLSGVPLASVVVATWWNVAASVFVTTCAVGLAAQADSRLERTLGHFVTLGLCGLAVTVSIAITGRLAFVSERALDASEAVGALVGVPLLLLALAWCVPPAAAAALALETETNPHPARVRLGVTVTATVAALIGLSLAFSWSAEVGAVAAFFLSLALLVAGFFAVSEGSGYPRSMRGLGVARPGAFRSTLTVFAALGLVGLGCFGLLVRDDHRNTAVALAAPSYVVLYLSLGVLLSRWTPLSRLGTRNGTRVGFFVATTLGIVGPVMVSVMADHRPDRGPLWLVDPFFGMVHFLDRSRLIGEAALLLGLAAIVATMAVLVLASEDVPRTHER